MLSIVKAASASAGIAIGIHDPHAGHDHSGHGHHSHGHGHSHSHSHEIVGTRVPGVVMYVGDDTEEGKKGTNLFNLLNLPPTLPDLLRMATHEFGINSGILEYQDTNIRKFYVVRDPGRGGCGGARALVLSFNRKCDVRANSAASLLYLYGCVGGKRPTVQADRRAVSKVLAGQPARTHDDAGRHRDPQHVLKPDPGVWLKTHSRTT